MSHYGFLQLSHFFFFFRILEYIVFWLISWGKNCLGPFGSSAFQLFWRFIRKPFLFQPLLWIDFLKCLRSIFRFTEHLKPDLILWVRIFQGSGFTLVNPKWHFPVMKVERELSSIANSFPNSKYSAPPAVPHALGRWGWNVYQPKMHSESCFYESVPKRTCEGREENCFLGTNREEASQ